MNKLSWLLAGIAIATAAFVLVLASPGAKAWQGGGSYGGSGDWTISNPTEVGSETVTVSGNINIQSGGSLTLWSVNIQMSQTSDGQYTINVASAAPMPVSPAWASCTSSMM